MTQRLPAIFRRFKTEQLRLLQGKNANAPLHSAQLGESGSFERQAQFSDLLARMQVNGVPYCKQEIDQIRTVDHLSESEREIALEIFHFGYEAAEKEGRQDKMWAYQRLLRRLLLHQPLDQPIHPNDRSQEIPRGMTVHDAEPSVTQQSPKQGDTPRPVRTAPVPRPVFTYALSAIGVAALIWTAFAFRSPTNIRDAVVPVHDNQQNIARASAAQEDRFEPAAHAGAFTPPAEIGPVAEGASARTAEPAPMSSAIDTQVATSSKSPATAKLDTATQPRMTKSPAKVANQATTVNAARGGNRERKPAKDPLPIYQTRHRILLREEPRFGAAGQIMLDQGARLIVLKTNSRWLQVTTEKTAAMGFVREEFLVPTGAAAPSSASKDQSPP